MKRLGRRISPRTMAHVYHWYYFPWARLPKRVSIPAISVSQTVLVPIPLSGEYSGRNAGLSITRCQAVQLVLRSAHEGS
jgi:hypothetical protein